MLRLLLLSGALLLGCHSRAAAVPSGTAQSFRLSASGGVGFDDLLFSPELHAVLAPAGGTGCVGVFDSLALRKSELCGVSPGGSYAGGHGEGTTSADSGGGFIFAIDRNSRSLKVADAKLLQVVAETPLAGGPDYVRWVEATHEVWVTEPDREQIEVFSLEAGTPPKLDRGATIAVKGGPESLVVDSAKGRAFTHLWSGRTVLVDVRTHAAQADFSNGCRGSRGIALDAKNGLLLSGCAEGKATVLDVEHGGKLLASASVPAGVDIIAVNLWRRHLYVPAASDGSVAVLGVSEAGALTHLGDFRAARGAHCVASDDHGRVWVCAPDDGTVLVFDDTFPAVTR
jgi:hypothetical protein